jgi:hypothetical protein
MTMMMIMMVGTEDVYLQMKSEPWLQRGLPHTQRPASVKGQGM